MTNPTPYGHDLSFGAPLMGGGITNIPDYRGSVFIVDGGAGNNTNFGTTTGYGSPGGTSAALKTITKAMALCTSGAGDTVFVLASNAGYAENVVVDKNYVSIIGCTVGGYGRPDVVPATGVPLTVTGQGVVIRHMRFAGTANDAVVQRGNGFEYSDCVFDGDLTASKAGLRLLPSDTVTAQTASEGKVFNNYFRGSAIGIAFDTALPAVGVGSTDNWIYNNRFTGNTIDIATADTGGAATYSVHTVVIGPGNTFEDKNKATYIDFTTTNGGAASDQTGTVTANGFATDTMTTTKIKAVGTGFTFMGNWDTVGIFDGSGLD